MADRVWRQRGPASGPALDRRLLGRTVLYADLVGYASVVLNAALNMLKHLVCRFSRQGGHKMLPAAAKRQTASSIAKILDVLHSASEQDT